MEFTTVRYRLKSGALYQLGFLSRIGREELPGFTVHRMSDECAPGKLQAAVYPRFSLEAIVLAAAFSAASCVGQVSKAVLPAVPIRPQVLRCP